MSSANLGEGRWCSSPIPSFSPDLNSVLSSCQAFILMALPVHFVQSCTHSWTPWTLLFLSCSPFLLVTHLSSLPTKFDTPTPHHPPHPTPTSCQVLPLMLTVWLQTLVCIFSAFSVIHSLAFFHCLGHHSNFLTDASNTGHLTLCFWNPLLKVHSQHPPSCWKHSIAPYHLQNKVETQVPLQ